MPAPSPEIQQRLLAEVGDPNSTIAPLIAGLWAAHAATLAGDGELIYLFVKRSLLDARLAEEVESTDILVGADVQDSQNQRSIHLNQMRADCQAEIARLVSVRAGGRSATGSLSRTAMEPPPAIPGIPDSNDPIYTGSPYRRRGLW